ncbi:AT-hook motif nuclear-localized protein 10 [Lactuca sativa]|uniref:AT-hook motif nuclear-localized protein n=1 Tax=Lactuca sativa TaxID=4236 RepID=A0A9R1XSF9_LACSA|nr:AT-hook motif nuclear-localized protein 10 [Lactuca sativa]KAJ0223794.1 hypothetical protein LSAT_V11C200076610 [Lactuca sativa]
MSYEASTMNNIRLTYNADGTPSYTHMVQPTSSSPTPDYNNPNGINDGGGDSGENNHALAVTTGINVNGNDVVKRKRGRPRKYAPDGSTPPAAALHGPAAGQSGDFSSPAPSSGKRPRGRPPGSGNKQQPAASGLPGAGFMPHILDVKSGEDVLAKLVWFSQNSTRALCILSASGSISNITLQQTATSGGTVTYEGRFEILSLSGSFMASESEDGQRSRTGGLSVALSGPDGRVLGGNVAGLLTAATPVQVIVGSFIPASQRQVKGGKGNTNNNNEAEVVNAPANHPVSGGSLSLSESSGGGLGSPVGVGQSNNSNPQGMGNNMGWR